MGFGGYAGEGPQEAIGEEASGPKPSKVLGVTQQCQRYCQHPFIYVELFLSQP